MSKMRAWELCDLMRQMMTVAVLLVVGYSAKSYSILCHLLEAVYQSSCRLCVCPHFETLISLRPVDRLQPNFIWTTIKAWMSSNLGRIPPLTLVLYNLVSTIAPSFLIGSSSYLQVTRTTIISQTISNFGQIRERMRS